MPKQGTQYYGMIKDSEHQSLGAKTYNCLLGIRMAHRQVTRHLVYLQATH